MLAVKRITAHSALFSALLAVTALIALLGVGLVGFLSISSIQGVRSGVVSLTGESGAYRVAAQRSAHPGAQNARLVSDLSRSIRAGGAPVPLTITRMLTYDEPVTLRVDGHAHAVQLRSMATLTTRARLTAGSWPTSADQVALQADAATRLGITPGDTVALPHGQTLTVSALWRARDPHDPVWMSDPLIQTGSWGSRCRTARR